MHEFISFNNQIFSAKNAFLSAVSSAALYGKGIFTTIAVHDSIPFLWEKHWRRLKDNALKLQIDLAKFSEERSVEALAAIIEKNKLSHGRARLTFYDNSPSSVWQTGAETQTNLLIQTAEFRFVSNEFRLTVSPYLINSTSPLAGVKSCNYLENTLALGEARARNFDEAVRLNERGEIVSACLANIFWKKDGAIYTPPLETGCLNGTTRQFLSETFIVTEQKAVLSELKKAEEIFLSSAGIGIVSCKFEISEK